MKRFNQYCPIAHALELVGERWALLIVRELVNGPRRYTDLAAQLPRIGTNILAGRLRDLEAAGVVRKHRLPPPAASQVYELTEYGHGLKPVLHALAHWGARSLGPPGTDTELRPGWLENALCVGVSLVATEGSFEFRVGGETASLVEGEVRAGPAESPDAVVEADPRGFFHLFVDGRFEGVSVEGDRAALERLVDAVVVLGEPQPVPA
jgi:DNA-binding HxlR family transcriptional regulator